MAIATEKRHLPKATLLVALLVTWEVTATWILPAYDTMGMATLPPPSKGVVTAFQMIMNGSLFAHVIASAKRVYFGFLIAAVIGIPVGVLMGLSPLIFRQLTPVIEVIRPIPPVAWIPLSLLWFGIADTQQYFIIFIGAVFPMILSTTGGVHRVEPILKRAALSLGANKLDLVVMMLRAASPSIFLGIRIALGLSWFIVVAAEMVAASRGLGYMITQGGAAAVTGRTYVGMFAIGIIGFSQDHLLDRLERKLMPWK